MSATEFPQLPTPRDMMEEIDRLAKERDEHKRDAEACRRVLESARELLRGIYEFEFPEGVTRGPGERPFNVVDYYGIEDVLGRIAIVLPPERAE